MLKTNLPILQSILMGSSDVKFVKISENNKRINGIKILFDFEIFNGEINFFNKLFFV
jgi:hypothetical protein